MNSIEQDDGLYVGLDPIRVFVIGSDGVYLEMPRLSTFSGSFNKQLRRFESSLEIDGGGGDDSCMRFLHGLPEGDDVEIEIRVPKKSPKRTVAKFGGLTNLPASVMRTPRSVLMLYGTME